MPRLAGAFAGGVFCAAYGGLSLPWWVFSAFYLLLIPGIIGSESRWHKRYTRRWRFGVLALLFFFFSGCHLVQLRRQMDHPAHFSKLEGQLLLLRLSEAITEKPRSVQVTARVLSVICPADARRAKGKLMVYLEKDSLAFSLRYGDVIVIPNRAQAVGEPLNPHQFNYSRYLAFRHMGHSLWVPGGEWQKTSENRGFFLMRWSLHLRHTALQSFSRMDLGEREFAILSALLLGYRELLDEDLRREFAGAGAMHILCVSGLHVGIIYLILRVLLSFLRPLPGGRYLQTAGMLLLIWLYASLTGFSPSVLRASTMFSFVAAGQSAGRPVNIYNTLSSSAILLLLIDPYMITHIGFQLSYLAVLGIVSLQPHFYALLECRWWLADKAWSILTVSMAAQLATGPLALYYFNQFPNYFLLTNLAVIPLSGGVIYAALVSLVTETLPVIGHLPARVLSLLLWLLQASVGWIEGLPHATTSGVYVPLLSVPVFFLFLVFAIRYLFHSVRRALLYALACLLFLAGSHVRHVHRLHTQVFFTVYAGQRSAAMDFVFGRECLALLCSELYPQPGQVNRLAGGQRIRYGVSSRVLSLPLDTSFIAHPLGLKKNNELLWFRGLLFWFTPPGHNQPAWPMDQADEHRLDYLVVSGNPRLDPIDILETTTPGRVIIDASNSPWVVERWEKACEALESDCWVVQRRGAYRRAI